MPQLEQITKPETKMVGGLKACSHVTPLEQRMGQLTLLFPATILNLPGPFRSSDAVLPSQDFTSGFTEQLKAITWV